MVETRQPESTQGAMRTNGWNGARPDIVQLFRVPERYLRSIHLERDFDDPTSLKSYVITPAMQASFSRVVAGLQSGSAHRAWRVTGDYGTGKSSFALVLAHLLRDPTSPVLEPLRLSIEEESEPGVLNGVRMLPVLVTGAREPLIPAVARALSRSLERLRGRQRRNKGIEDLEAQADAVISSANHSELLDLLEGVSSYAATHGCTGVFLVLDELGKFLEYAALRSDKEDVYILQRLAESAATNSRIPLVVLSLLHQGFHAYAESLPSTTRQEWEKVADRYSEITFDQPLAHVTALVTEALNIDRQLVPEDVNEAAHAVQAATVKAGWYGMPEGAPSILNLYPLHPTVLPVLVRFFARFGQHERSLFSFLLSSEPFGLQAFAGRPAMGSNWYRLPDFYDYVRSTFGYRLSSSSYRSNWLRMVETIDRMRDLDALQVETLKAVAVLNVLDAEHLLATQSALEAALTDGEETGAVSRAVESLKGRGLLFDRGNGGGYSLWPSTSVNLVSAFEAAKRALDPMDRIAARVRPYLGQSSVVARRHYIERGTLRYFEVRYTDPSTILESIEQPTEADGLVTVVLCDSPDEHRSVRAMVAAREVASHREIIVAVPPPLQGVAPGVLDAQCWQWVAENTPELSQDSFAAAEVARQVAASRTALLRSFDALLGFRGEHSNEVEWWHRGKLMELPVRGKLSAIVSSICDELYSDAPRIRNELLNRHTLSSAASAARLRLVERMFASSGERFLGLDRGKAPPEKSMYLSLLSAGNVHREEEGQFVLSEPAEGEDPLNLRPALTLILELLEGADGRRVPVPDIFAALQSRPYGVRAGVTPFLLAIVVVAHAHEIAVFENGTFRHEVSSHDFMRLMKQPHTFELQLCRLIGVRAEVFTLLARTFASGCQDNREQELLDVVRPLIGFIVQLPDYTRRNSILPDKERRVRDVLLAAREPTSLLFEALPRACGFDPFPTDGPTDAHSATTFVIALQEALISLGTTYRRLLDRIHSELMLALGDGSAVPDRAQVSRRAARVIIAAREPRLGTFARCLSDNSLSDDSWIERIGSFLLSNPLVRWTTNDEARAIYEIGVLSATFCRVEATAFEGLDNDPQTTAVRIALTGGDGSEAARIVRVRAEDVPSVEALADRVEQLLDGSIDIKLAAISRILWNSLLENTQAQSADDLKGDVL